MSFTDSMIQLDHWLFTQINLVWTNPFFDVFFPYITDLVKRPLFGYFIFPALLIYSLYRGRGRAATVIAGALIVFGISDGLTHRIYKASVQRQRPEFTLEKVKLRTHSHSGYSFPSNHASNSFAIMTFLGFFLVRFRWWLMLYAASVAYSRVYVGVHFPIDVIAGALSGSAIAIAVYLAFRKLKIPKVSFSRET